MIISILDKKYKCGSERGIGELTEPGVVDILNSIIDWDKSTFPPDLDKETIIEEDITDYTKFIDQPSMEGVLGALVQGKLDRAEEGEVTNVQGYGDIVYRGGKVYHQQKTYEQKRDYLGTPPELKPGNVFLWDNQIIAVDRPDRLVLSISESGMFALKRIWEEHILPEYIILNGSRNEDEQVPVEITSIDALKSDGLLEQAELQDWVDITDDIDKNLWRKFLRICEPIEKTLRTDNLPIVVDFNVLFSNCQLLIYPGTKIKIMFDNSDKDINGNDFGKYFFPQFINSLWLCQKSATTSIVQV